jgi:hypothetical protein
VIILCLCYVITNAFAIDRFDYIIILYIFFLNDINEDTVLKYAITFGLFYDLNYQIFLGLGILLFQGLNLLKIYIFQLVDMSKGYSRFFNAAGVILLYVLLTVKFSGYPADTYWLSSAYHFATNAIAAAIFMIVFLFITGGRHAFPAA